MSLINIKDPLDSEAKQNNFLNNLPYSDQYKQLAQKWIKFPVYDNKEKLSELLALIDQKQVILVVSGTGSGKTVLIPKYILKYMVVNKIKGITAVTNPKILTTIYNAEYGAKTLDVNLGEEVGYKFRGSIKEAYDEHKTQLLYVTDGLILTTILNRDPLLKQYNAIIIDEAHERQIQIDLLLYFLKQILDKRPEFKLIIMSATINAEVFKNYFDIETLRYGEIHFSTQSNYKIEQKWELQDDQITKINYLEKAIDKVIQIINNNPEGDIIIFVPTKRETIRGCEMFKKKCPTIISYKKICSQSFCIEVYSKMKETKQQLAVEKDLYKSKGNYNIKIIFATNVAESSITFEGLKYVIDTGYELINTYVPLKNKSSLIKTMTSQAQIKQRIGRCGRTSDGIAYMLYTKKIYDRLELYPKPSIMKINITPYIFKFLGYCKTLSNLFKIINDLITIPTFDQMIAAIYRMHFNRIIKMVNKDNEIIPFETMNYRVMETMEDLYKYNGSLTTLGWFIIKLDISSIEMGISLVASMILNCKEQMIIILAIYETCGYKTDELFFKKNNIYQHAVNNKSDHLTLLNIYTDYYKNQIYKGLNIKLWHKIEIFIEKLTKKLQKISMRKLNVLKNYLDILNLSNKYVYDVFNKEIDSIDDRIIYSLLIGNKFNIIENGNSINYLINSKTKIEPLFLVKNKQSNVIATDLINILDNTRWANITFIK